MTKWCIPLFRKELWSYILITRQEVCAFYFLGTPIVQLTRLIFYCCCWHLCYCCCPCCWQDFCNCSLACCGRRFHCCWRPWCWWTSCCWHPAVGGNNVPAGALHAVVCIPSVAVVPAFGSIIVVAGFPRVPVVIAAVFVVNASELPWTLWQLQSLYTVPTDPQSGSTKTT